MKVSELITKIIATAEEKFEVDEMHTNDAISVSIFPQPSLNNWQATLIRPSQHALDQGEVNDTTTRKICEYRRAFHVEGEDLMDVLYQLLDQVESASEFDFTP